MNLGLRAPAWAFLLATCCAAAAARPLAARQQDTVPPPPDTTAAAQDTMLPPPLLVPWPARRNADDEVGVWTWDRDSLARAAAYSLLDLLNAVPGITSFRGGVFLQPEAATFDGGGAGRTEIDIDGYVLDPLTAASLDLSLISLGAIDHVRVERRMDRLRISLSTVEPEDARPFSRIEAAVGQPRANLFRGGLLSPRVILGPFGFAVERIESQGSGQLRPADDFDTWVKWGLLREDRGVQLEWRGNTLNRDPDSEIPLKRSRGDLVLRARNRFAPDLLAEAYYAASRESVEPTDPAIPDSLRATLKEKSRQIGLRGALERDRLGADVALRFRDNDALARWQADLTAHAVPFPRTDLSARATLADWRTRRTNEYAAAASFRPLESVRLFGELSSGIAGTPVRGDTTRTGPAFSDRSTWRAGLEVRRRGLEAGAAGVHVEMDSVVAFGFPGDTANPVVRGGAVTGWEAWARVPLGPDWLSGSVTYSNWTSGTRWAYLPASTLRATVDLHAIPLESGNLELTGILEVRQRGVLAAPPGIPGDPLLDVPARTRINAYFQIRIIEIRAFIRWEDLEANDISDLPGFPVRGPRIVYGVKWTFWN